MPVVARPRLSRPHPPERAGLVAALRFGEVNIDGRGQFRVDLRDLDGTAVFSKTLAPKRRGGGYYRG
ncbi:MAG TPA: hypothetical protein VFR90_11610 [Methylibium sp.]|uniref:hypothetical protein n=1 Tax=Methylibium sp. TaxID=2067992 RepID=UPI002DB6314F|nr:hypothetical protein [Methylibium sp.]HEU4459760.1 hypothetical protein [Methylibium sp.]